MNLLILSERNIYKKKKHVSYDTVLGLENEFLKCNKNNSIIHFSNTVFLINKIISKISKGFIKGLIDNNVKKIVKNVSSEESMIFFAAMNSYEILLNLPTLKKIHKKLIIYVFDCWESMWNKYKSIFEQIDPYAICFAYEKSRQHFEMLGFKNCWFMPQSMDVNYFNDYNMSKNRMFMQMGRRVNNIHKLILKYLNDNGIEDKDENYVYEREKGNIIFPETKQLAQEINATMFFIAVPQCVHNKKVTGDISDVTARYYEAMACKTLILGIKPKDTFDILFPYPDAMIEVSEENFNDVINELMSDKDKYKSIVEKNYSYVMKHHRWKNRYDELIKQILSSGVEN